MLVFQNLNYVSNITRGFSTIDLVNIYNTQTYGKYYKELLNDTRDMHCLLITINGKGNVILKDGTIFSTNANKVFIGTLSTITALQSKSNDWHFVIYWFIPLNLKLPENQTVFIKNMNPQTAEDETNKLIKLLQTRIDTKIYYANSFFYCLLFKVLEEINPYSEKSNTIIQNIMDYINAHIREPLRISDISKKFGYCEKHIRYLFASILKTSPKKYINRTKLENICYFLANTNTSVTYLSETFSFNSVNHLCNNFKKEYGITPSEYRMSTNTDLARNK